MKGKETKPEIKLLRTENRQLLCKLTDEEQRQAGNELAAICEDKAAEETRQADIKTQLKAKLAELESRLSQVAIKVRRKEEYRGVDVRVELLADGETCREVRTDTGELLKIRKAEPYERQATLDLLGNTEDTK